MLKREITLAEEITILLLAVVLCAIAFWFGRMYMLTEVEDECVKTSRLYGMGYEFSCEVYKP